VTDDIGKNVYNFVAIAGENQRLYMQLLAGCSPQCGSWLAGWWRMALSHIWSSVTYHGRERKCGLAHSLPLPSTIHDSTLLPFQHQAELHPETTVKHFHTASQIPFCNIFHGSQPLAAISSTDKQVYMHTRALEVGKCMHGLLLPDLW